MSQQTLASDRARSGAGGVEHPVLLVILDGFGFNPNTEERVLAAAIARLGAEPRSMLLAAAQRATAKVGDRSGALPEAQLLRLALTPVLLTAASSKTLKPFAAVTWAELANLYQCLREEMQSVSFQGESLLALAASTVQQEACRARYAIWCADTPYLHSLRNDFPTVITQASGKAAGYEDLIPAVQGNSETGHQQIGNFTVAAQVPLQISAAIEDGSFFENQALQECLEDVQRNRSSLDVCFLLSGEFGDDGRVHSSWNHLEALLEAVFVRAKLPPSRLRIEAVLDGRDSPPRSSLERKGDRYGFLDKLRDLLARYGAEESLAWVVGRSIAMDRDYEESRARQHFELLVDGKGAQATNISAAIEAVRRYHEEGKTDTNIPPIVVGAQPRRVESGDAFLDLNFRADRQRETIASLLGASDFLQREASAKGRTWKLGWLKPPSGITVYCLAEYHPEFETVYGAKTLYPTLPQAHNFFAVVPEQSVQQGFPFHYLLTAESTKALHVGYFIRGRREQPVEPSSEDRHIIPSYGEEFGIATDDDYYKTPQMRAFALTDFVVESLAKREYDLIAVNFSNADMIGHLLPRRFDAAVRAVTVIDTALQTVVPAALRNGYTTVLTADHGNVEDDDSSHTVNDILTSFVAPENRLRLRGDPRRPARLFDIPWSMVEIMGINDRVLPHLPPVPGKIRAEGLVGHSLVETVARQEPAR